MNDHIEMPEPRPAGARNESCHVATPENGREKDMSMTPETDLEPKGLGTMNRRKVLSLAGAAATVAAVSSLGRPSHAQGKPSLVVAIPTDINNTDPQKISGGGDHVFFNNIFEGLYTRDPDGTLAPGLAESVEVSADGKAYSVVLRSNAKFHNGDDVTAQDVEFTWKRAIDPTVENPHASIIAANIERIEIVDAKKLTIHLKKPDSTIRENMDIYFYILPKKYFESVGAAGFVAKPVGTGPFSFVERRTGEYFKLKAFDDHWGRVPQVGEVTFRIVRDEQTRIAQLLTGESDIAASMPLFLAQRYSSNPKLKIVSAAGYQNYFLAINIASANTALANEKVRRALNLAIDKKTIFDALTFGYGTLQANAPCSPGVVGCDGSIPDYPFDPQEAKKILTEEGFDFARPFTIVSTASGRFQLSRELAESAAYYLQQIGINARVEIMEYGAWSAQNFQHPRNPNVDLNFLPFPDFNNEPIARLLRTIHTKGSHSFFSDPEIDQILDTVNQITDPAKRKAAIAKLFADIHEKAAVVTLWSMNTIYGTAANIDWVPQKVATWPVIWNVKKNA